MLLCHLDLLASVLFGDLQVTCRRLFTPCRLHQAFYTFNFESWHQSSHGVTATSQFLCAIADILFYSLSSTQPIFLGQICTGILCVSILFSALASSCIQIDVTPSMSLSALTRERLGARPLLLLALIGVVISTACIPSNSSAALVSCSCFCGLSCFLFGFPGPVDPQFKSVTKGDDSFFLTVFFVHDGTMS